MPVDPRERIADLISRLQTVIDTPGIGEKDRKQAEKELQASKRTQKTIEHHLRAKPK